MNWLVNILQKEARRFNPDDYVRYFSQGRKGTGKGIVITPSFSRGKVIDFDQKMKKYKVLDERDNREVLVHPRNLVPDSVSYRSQSDLSPQIDTPAPGFNGSMPLTNI